MNKGIILIGPEPPPFGGMASQAKLLTDRLAGEGVQVFFIPTNKTPDLFSAKLWALPVFRTVGKFFMYLAGIVCSLRPYRTIHILACSHMYFYLNVIPAVLIGRIFKKRVVVNYRGGEADSFFKGVAGYFLSAFRLADSLIVPSGYLKSVFHELGIQARIIPNISEIERFQFSAPDYKDHIKFVCTRNFEAYYDIPTLIRAFRLVKDEIVDSSLTLIGDGSLKQEIMDLVYIFGLSGCVEFLGKIDPHDMPEYLSRHDIFVNSSIVDNYPISLLEAFSSGLPVISTSAGGIPYMVENGVTGILVASGDHKALAKNMTCLARDPNLGRRLAVDARRVAEEHSWEKIWPKLKAEYQW
jgi:glycosyltransferase involved in cell wall biosynthesis